MFATKALAATLGAVMSVTLLTAGTAAPAGARTPSASSAPSGAGAGWSLSWRDCISYYGDHSFCCYYAYSPPRNLCGFLWDSGWSGAARSAPTAPGRTD